MADAPTPAKPATKVREAMTVTVDIEKLKPDPARVEQERSDNMWRGVGFAAFDIGSSVALGHMLLNVSAPTSRALIWGLIAGAVAAPIGAAIGRNAKTSEEERSETLIRAATSGQFEAALKHDVAKREREAYNAGASI